MNWMYLNASLWPLVSGLICYWMGFKAGLRRGYGDLESEDDSRGE